MQRPEILAILAQVGERIDDAAEETFVLFSHDFPQNDLGILDVSTAEVDVDVDDTQYTIKQSSSLLRSARDAGTTGAVMWKVTPLVARWLKAPQSVLWQHGLLASSSVVVELGCGVSGLIGLVLASRVSCYVLTDQEYVMKILKDNIESNSTQISQRRNRRAGADKSRQRDDRNLKLLTLDWEEHSCRNITACLPDAAEVDMVVLCDCIYNIYLISPLAQMCLDICRMNPNRTTLLLIAQQLRSDEVFEQWLTTMMKHFYFWRLRDDQMPPELASESGYILHLAMLQSSS